MSESEPDARVFRFLSWNVFYATLTAGSNSLLLLLLIVAGRTLGDAEYGKFSFALALTTIFETLMDFGLMSVTVRAVARDRSRASHVLQNALGLKLLWASLALVVLWFTARLLSHEADVRMACYVMGGSAVMRSYLLTVRGVFQGLERFGWESLVVVADRVLLLVAGVAALQLGTGLHGLSLSFLAARVVALALAAHVVWRQLGQLAIRFDWPTWKELQRTAIPLGIFMVVLNLYSYIDTVMLDVLRTHAETGWYAGGYRVYEGLTYAPSIMAAVLAPRLSTLFVTDRSAHRLLAWRAVGLAAGMGLVIGGVMVAVAEPVLRLLFGAAFLPGTPALRILSAGAVFVFAIWILHAVAVSSNREHLLLKTGLVGLAVNVGSNLYLIPHFGIVGAASATVLGEAVSASFLVWGLRSTLAGAVRAEASR